MQYQIFVRPNKILLLPLLITVFCYSALIQYSLIHLSIEFKLLVFVTILAAGYFVYLSLKNTLPKQFLLTACGVIIYQQQSYTSKLWMNNFFGWFLIRLQGKQIWVLHASMMTPKDASRLSRLLG